MFWFNKNKEKVELLVPGVTGKSAEEEHREAKALKLFNKCDKLSEASFGFKDFYLSADFPNQYIPYHTSVFNAQQMRLSMKVIGYNISPKGIFGEDTYVVAHVSEKQLSIYREDRAATFIKQIMDIPDEDIEKAVADREAEIKQAAEYKQKALDAIYDLI